MTRDEYIKNNYNNLQLYAEACSKFGNSSKEVALGKMYDNNFVDINLVVNKLTDFGILNSNNFLSKHKEANDLHWLLKSKNLLLIEDTASGYQFWTHIIKNYYSDTYVLNPTDILGGTQGGIGNLHRAIQELHTTATVYILYDDDVTNDNSWYRNKCTDIIALCKRAANFCLFSNYVGFESLIIGFVYMIDWYEKFTTIDDSTKDIIVQLSDYLHNINEVEIIPFLPKNKFVEGYCSDILNSINVDRDHLLNKKHIEKCWKYLCKDLNCTKCNLATESTRDKLYYLFENSYYSNLGGITNVKNLQLQTI